jgi:hypothetical protein
MKQTAVEFLASVLSQTGPITEDDFNSLVEQAKQMEKEQIIDAHGIKKDYSFSLIYPQIITGEQYYTDTFKQQEQ